MVSASWGLSAWQDASQSGWAGGAHAPCQGIKGRARLRFPSCSSGRRISQGRLKTLGFGAESALAAPPGHLRIACFRVTRRWLKQQRVTEQSQLGRPCPGPGAASLTTALHTGSLSRPCLLTETLQGALRSEPATAGPWDGPGGRRGPRERTSTPAPHRSAPGST